MKGANPPTAKKYHQMVQESIDITTHPVQIGGTDLFALQKAFTLDFGYGYPLQYMHGYADGKTTFTIIHDGELPSGIKSEDTAKLHKMDVAGKPVYFYRTIFSDGKIIELNDKVTELEISKIIEKRRPRQILGAKQLIAHVPAKTSAPITLPEVAERIAGKRYFFFTGAGLSVNVVPDWNGLMLSMGYDRKRSDIENLADTLGTINHRLPELMQGLHNTHLAFIKGTPSDGHLAISNMCKLTGQPALTDNRDLIQQASGTHAIHVNQLTPFSDGPWQPPIACNATDIDGVIVCGMGGDRRGFLKWLKSNNPNAEIIHMDLAPCKELQANSFIQGDIQTLLPQLQKEVASKIASQIKAASIEVTGDWQSRIGAEDIQKTKDAVLREKGKQ